MLSLRSILVPISLACALAAPACDSHVALGTIGYGDSGEVLWRATFEPGDLSEWTLSDNGGTYAENPPIAPVVTTDVAHGGRYAGKSTMMATMGMAGMVSSSYFYRSQTPLEGYYSAWFYVPSTALVRTWLSLVHFLVSATGDGQNVNPIWDLNLYPRPADGTLTTHLYNYDTQVNADQLVNNTVPLDRWVHFEILLRKAADSTGRLAVWQDDVEIVDLEDIVTAKSYWLKWEVGGASNDIEPAPSSIYVDDAAISLQRLGTGMADDEPAQP